MDIPYAVKQLAHEIAIAEEQLREKKTAYGKLRSLLSAQDQFLFPSLETPQPQPDKPTPKPKQL